MAKKTGNTSDLHLSKTLSWILRHGALQLGLSLDSEGFIAVEDLLNQPNLRDYSQADVQRVVLHNSKQRFALKTDSETSKLLIRANQGHSLNVENLDLKRIHNASAFPTVVHGTFWKNYDSIMKSGLSRMNRQHIHFALGLPGEKQVISGMRNACDLYIYLNLELALKDGYKFFLSANNVLLCPGNENGCIPEKYFLKVEQR